MSKRTTGAEGSTDSWNTYWRGTRHGAAYTGGDGTHPLVPGFWDETFAALQSRKAALRIVDVASGNGALVERARAAFGEAVQLTCIDISAAAVRSLVERFTGVQGIVADARTIPLASGAYDMVVSQFGIEYAGLDAVGEAARLAAPGAEIALLLHYRDGGIHRQCAAGLAAVRDVQDAEFLPLAIEMFEAGFAAIRGGDRGRFEAAARRMAPAVRTTESVIRRYGRQVADGTILRLYQDVKTMHDRMQHYDPGDVLDWLRGMQDELTAYAGRMASMCDAAIDEAQFDGLCEDLRQRGFQFRRRGPLVDPERDLPLAWSLVAVRAL